METILAGISPIDSPSSLCITLPDHNSCLPPIKTLPNWTRSQLSHRVTEKRVIIPSNKKRPFVEDLKDSEKETQTTPPTTAQKRSPSLINIVRRRNSCHSRSSDRVVKTIEKNIDFLTKDHSQVLSALHEEITSLKYQNQALNFRLVMTKKHDEVLSDADKDRKLRHLEEEVLRLRRSLQQSENSNMLLTKELQNQESAIMLSNETKSEWIRKKSTKKCSLKKKNSLLNNNVESLHSNKEIQRNKSKQLVSSKEELILPKLTSRNSRFSKAAKKPASNSHNDTFKLPQLNTNKSKNLNLHIKTNQIPTKANLLKN